MAKVQVIKKTFNDQKGLPIVYRVLAISGSISGEPYTLELKAGKSELDLATILLASEEVLTISSRASTPEENTNFLDEFDDVKE